jgi:hypothetical protein
MKPKPIHSGMEKLFSIDTIAQDDRWNIIKQDFLIDLRQNENLPGGTRTLDHLLRRQMLYPAELLGDDLLIYNTLERCWSSKKPVCKHRLFIYFISQ